MGGIEFILGLYAYTTSREASDNLFTVLFDYAVSEVGDKKRTGQTGACTPGSMLVVGRERATSV